MPDKPNVKALKDMAPGTIINFDAPGNSTGKAVVLNPQKGYLCWADSRKGLTGVGITFGVRDPRRTFDVLFQTSTDMNPKIIPRWWASHFTEPIPVPKPLRRIIPRVTLSGATVAVASFIVLTQTLQLLF